MIRLTDAERAYAETPIGRSKVAQIQRQHDLREAHKGSAARQWTDEMEASAIRSLATYDARNRVQTRALDATLQDSAGVERAAYDTAMAVQRNRVGDAWRGGADK